jgi:hypothetical protein
MSSNAPPPEQRRERVKHLLEEDLAQSGMYPDELVTVLLAMAAERPMHPIAPPPMRVTDYATAAYGSATLVWGLPKIGRIAQSKSWRWSAPQSQVRTVASPKCPWFSPTPD